MFGESVITSVIGAVSIISLKWCLDDKEFIYSDKAR
jgi:hypothetical protein